MCCKISLQFARQEVKVFGRSLGGSEAVIVRLAAPIKYQWAADHALDYEEMLSTSEYKEKHRLGMVKWSDKLRNEQPCYFIDKAILMSQGDN